MALVRPLVEARLLPAAWPVTVNAVSGYSGGGKAMIAEFEDRARATMSRRRSGSTAWAWRTSTCRRCRSTPAWTHPPMFAARGRPLRPGHAGRGSAAALGPAGQAVPWLDLHARPGRRLRRRALRRGRLAGQEAARQLQGPRPRGPERHQPAEAVRVRQRRSTARPGWWPCSTTSARAPRARRCRTST